MKDIQFSRRSDLGSRIDVSFEFFPPKNDVMEAQPEISKKVACPVASGRPSQVKCGAAASVPLGSIGTIAA